MSYVKRWLPCLLSLVRIPLALLFLSDNLAVRCLALFFAGLSDFLDGRLARKWNVESHLGATLDPIADKCFAAIAFGVFWMEGQLGIWQLVALFTREISLVAFALYLKVQAELGTYRVRAILTGKIITVLQGIVALLLIFHVHVPGVMYMMSFLLGVMAFFELVMRPKVLIEER